MVGFPISCGPDDLGGWIIRNLGPFVCKSAGPRPGMGWFLFEGLFVNCFSDYPKLSHHVFVKTDKIVVYAALSK